MKVTVYFNIINGGDGSAAVNFFASKEDAELNYAYEQNMFGENFTDPYFSAELEFDDAGKLLNPDQPTGYAD